MALHGMLKDIYIYPVKSLPGVRLDKAYVTRYGLVHPNNNEIRDRRWMVINAETGSFMSQRQLPKMALIKLKLDNPDYLEFSFEAKSSIKVPILPSKNQKKNCRVWSHFIDGYSYGGEISKWLSDVLEKENLDLVCFGDDLQPRENDPALYADSSPFMLISENSLNDLNNRLESKVTMRNFRPNFVVDECKAFAEDEWQKINIGDSKFTRLSHCTRCLLTTVDPNRGVKDPNQQPFNTLKQFRLREDYGQKPIFGVHFASENNEQRVLIRVGDKITDRI